MNKMWMSGILKDVLNECVIVKSNHIDSNEASSCNIFDFICGLRLYHHSYLRSICVIVNSKINNLNKISIEGIRTLGTLKNYLKNIREKENVLKNMTDKTYTKKYIDIVKSRTHNRRYDKTYIKYNSMNIAYCISYILIKMKSEYNTLNLNKTEYLDDTYIDIEQFNKLHREYINKNKDIKDIKDSNSTHNNIRNNDIIKNILVDILKIPTVKDGKETLEDKFLKIQMIHLKYLKSNIGKGNKYYDIYRNLLNIDYGEYTKIYIEILKKYIDNDKIYTIADTIADFILYFLNNKGLSNNTTENFNTIYDTFNSSNKFSDEINKYKINKDTIKNILDDVLKIPYTLQSDVQSELPFKVQSGGKRLTSYKLKRKHRITINHRKTRKHKRTRKYKRK